MAVLGVDAQGASGGGGVRLASVGEFNQPTYVHGPKGAGDVVFVVEKAGRVRVVKGGRVQSGTFLDISRKVSSDGERGLLSIAFRNYKRSRLFYVFYTDRQGDLRIAEYKRKRGKLKARPRSGG